MNHRLLVLGGVESIDYSGIASFSNLRVDYVPHVKKITPVKVRNYKGVICFTAQVSHAMARGVKRLASKNKVPVYFLHSSSKTKFSCFLQEYCNKNCLLNKKVNN